MPDRVCGFPPFRQKSKTQALRLATLAQDERKDGGTGLVQIHTVRDLFLSSCSLTAALCSLPLWYLRHRQFDYRAMLTILYCVGPQPVKVLPQPRLRLQKRAQNSNRLGSLSGRVGDSG